MLRSTPVSLPALLLALFGCGGELGATAARLDAIVYGADDRVEYFQLADLAARERMERSTVALIPNKWIDRVRGRIDPSVPLWGQVGALCSGEPFADQPAAAFCTGTLVDWDLVLTAGHCVRVLPVGDFSLVFGYYFEAAARLALAADDIVAPAEIVAEAWGRDGDSDGEVLDYAWIRLARPVAPPREPVPVYTEVSALEDAPLLTIGAASGTPLKADPGGVALSARGQFGYFVANTDTSAGWSGGGAFDDARALVGILARGGPDLVSTDAGCQATQRAAANDGEEEFTYTYRAVEELCAQDPRSSTICRVDCGQPCLALPPDAAARDNGQSGCTLAPGVPLPTTATLVSLVIAWSAMRLASRRGKRVRLNDSSALPTTK